VTLNTQSFTIGQYVIAIGIYMVEVAIPMSPDSRATSSPRMAMTRSGAFTTSSRPFQSKFLDIFWKWHLNYLHYSKVINAQYGIYLLQMQVQLGHLL